MRINNFSTLRALLFENQSTNQTIFKNTFWLTVGTTISRILKLILVIYVARTLGATEYGKFTFALAFVSLFLVLSNLGLPTIVTREFSREKERERELYSIFSLKIILSLGALIFILIGSFLITPDETIRKVIWILSLYVLITSFYSIIYGFFDAHQKFEYEALGEIFSAIMVTGLGFLVIFNFLSVENLSYAYLLAGAVSLIFILFIFHTKFLPLKLFWQKEVWRKFLSVSWPLALAGLFTTLYTYIDSTIMGHLNQITQTGWYNASYGLVNVALLPMGLVAGSFFPVLTKFALPLKQGSVEELKTAKVNLQKVWDLYFEIIILLAVPLMIGGIALASKIIGVIYGQGFLPSILAFQILIIMAGIIFLYRPFSEVLTASNQQKKILWAAVLGAIVSVILNLIFIPKFSLYGAAATAALTHLLIFSLLFKFTSRFTLIEPLKLKFLLTALAAFFSGGIMYLTISRPQIFNLHIAFSFLIGAAVYALILLILKKIADVLRLKIII